LRDTTQKIAGATLRECESVRRWEPKERKRRYENDTLAFLDERSGGLSCRVSRTRPDGCRLTIMTVD
jgi:hypothetical protein